MIIIQHQIIFDSNTATSEIYWTKQDHFRPAIPSGTIMLTLNARQTYLSRQTNTLTDCMSRLTAHSADVTKINCYTVFLSTDCCHFDNMHRLKRRPQSHRAAKTYELSSNWISKFKMRSVAAAAAAAADADAICCRWCWQMLWNRSLIVGGTDRSFVYTSAENIGSVGNVPWFFTVFHRGHSVVRWSPFFRTKVERRAARSCSAIDRFKAGNDRSGFGRPEVSILQVRVHLHLPPEV